MPHFICKELLVIAHFNFFLLFISQEFVLIVMTLLRAFCFVKGLGLGWISTVRYSAGTAGDGGGSRPCCTPRPASMDHYAR
jgi:hypothetical protein